MHFVYVGVWLCVYFFKLNCVSDIRDIEFQLATATISAVFLPSNYYYSLVVQFLKLCIKVSEPDQSYIRQRVLMRKERGHRKCAPIIKLIVKCLERWLNTASVLHTFFYGFSLIFSPHKHTKFVFTLVFRLFIAARLRPFVFISHS